jgi:diaminopimelate decarboxylase
VHLNVDNMQELDRVTELLRTHDCPGASVGMRINPQVGQGDIPAMSTATATSKFGVPLLARRWPLPLCVCAADRHAHTQDTGEDAIVDALRTRPWLRRLHCHVGSQGAASAPCAAQRPTTPGRLRAVADRQRRARRGAAGAARERGGGPAADH